LPDVGLEPFQPPDAVQEIALVLDQVSVDVAPVVIPEGDAESATVGAGLVPPLVGGGAGSCAPPLLQAVIAAEPQRIKARPRSAWAFMLSTGKLQIGQSEGRKIKRYVASKLWTGSRKAPGRGTLSRLSEKVAHLPKQASGGF